MFVFGEKWCYSRFVFPEGLRKWCLNTLRIPLLAFWCAPLSPFLPSPLTACVCLCTCAHRGRGGTLLPHKTPAGLGVVYGAPMEVPKLANPTPDQVKAVLDAYTAAVVALYDTHKHKFGYGKEETLVVL